MSIVKAHKTILDIFNERMMAFSDVVPRIEPVMILAIENYEAVLFFLYKDQKIQDIGRDILSDELAEHVDKYLESQDFFKEYPSAHLFPIIGNSSHIKHIAVIGLGEKNQFCSIKFERTVRKIANTLNAAKVKKVLIIEPENELGLFERIAFCMRIVCYKFSLKTLPYLAKEEGQEEKKYSAEFSLERADIVLAKQSDIECVKKALKTNEDLVRAINFVKVCADAPPNIMTPDFFAKKVQGTIEHLQNHWKEKGFTDAGGLSVKVLGPTEMKQENMGALLGVSKGSVEEPRLVVMEYRGNPDIEETQLAFVGKGVTFDTGGYNLKPSNSLIGMKYDMSGAAICSGLFWHLAKRRAKVNFIAVVACTENMISGAAQKPEDVVVSMCGQTIEILDTDAEGRLILADALCYAQKYFKPQNIIDLATLTGAAIVALGTNAFGALFSNSDWLAELILKSGNKTSERFWRLPLDGDYNKLMDSKIADMQNISSVRGYGAGSATAAEFLGRFISGHKSPHADCSSAKDSPYKPNWAHLDIAAMDNRGTPTEFEAAGSTGFGVRCLDYLVREYFEKEPEDSCTIV